MRAEPSAAAHLFLHGPRAAGRSGKQPEAAGAAGSRGTQPEAAGAAMSGGLTERERGGCAALLRLMEAEDLLSLSDTVTGRLVVVESAEEAAETVLSFTQSAEELLRRRKVQRDLIFKYLVGEGVKMPPNSDKHQLMRRTRELWTSGHQVSASCRAPKETQLRPETPRETPSSKTWSDPPPPKAEATFDPLALGQQFCQWFFPLLNSQNPTVGREPQQWGPQHFWPDVRLRLLARTDSERSEEFVGAELVSLRLQSLTRDERLLLSPNLEAGGLRALASPHGLVLVGVAGTIHRGAACLGVYEQTFGLIRSPLEQNNWKVKFTELKIRGQDALGGSQEATPTLTFSSNELRRLCSS